MHCRSKRIKALEQGLALWRPAATMFMTKALFVVDSHLMQCLEIFEVVIKPMPRRSRLVTKWLVARTLNVCVQI